MMGLTALTPDELPRHLAVIMDGNGRWAKMRGLDRSEGHRAGARAVREIVTECRSLGIGWLTLYAFSSENWNRPPAEIAALFNLLVEFLRVETPLMAEKGIRLNVLGDMNGLPVPQRLALKHSMAKTARGEMVLNLALNYSSRTELVNAIKTMLEEKLDPTTITEDTISQYLYTSGMPDPDLVIRTSGEQRLSNYLLYQCAYSELYFTNTLWPDFDKHELRKALVEYSSRTRRFGFTEEQALLKKGGAHGG